MSHPTSRPRIRRILGWPETRPRSGSDEQGNARLCAVTVAAECRRGHRSSRCHDQYRRFRRYWFRSRRSLSREFSSAARYSDPLQRPALAVGVRPHRHGRTRTEPAKLQIVGRRSGIFADRPWLVGHKPVVPGGDLLRITAPHLSPSRSPCPRTPPHRGRSRPVLSCHPPWRLDRRIRRNVEAELRNQWSIHLRPNAIRNQVEAATDSIGGRSQDRNRVVARGRSYAVGWAEIAMSPARIVPTGVYGLCNPHCESPLYAGSSFGNRYRTCGEHTRPTTRVTNGDCAVSSNWPGDHYPRRGPSAGSHSRRTRRARR